MNWLVTLGVISVGLAGGIRGIHWGLRRRRARELAFARTRGLPSAVLLLQVAIAAGLSPRAAISAVGAVPVDHGELAVATRDFALVGERLELGADLASAILSLGEHETSVSFIGVLDVMRRAEVDGVALATHLELVLQDLRRDRARALDAAAQRLTVSLLFPLVVCILPAFVLLAVVPLLLGALSSLPG